MDEGFSTDEKQQQQKKKPQLYKPGQSGNPVGRPKGCKNKLTLEVKEMLIKALEAEGGIEYFRHVAREKPEVFCTLIGRLIPTRVQADLTVAMPTLIVRNYTGRALPEQEQGVIDVDQEASEQ